MNTPIQNEGALSLIRSLGLALKIQIPLIQELSSAARSFCAYVKARLVVVAFSLILSTLAGCSGGGESSTPKAQGLSASAAPVTASAPAAPTPTPTVVKNEIPTDRPVLYWLDELFPSKEFSGMRSLIHGAKDLPSEKLINCTVRVETNRSCNFSEIPLIGMDHSAPTVDQIMSRVLVSHDWMATRMREILESMPAETLLMTRGISAIVISYDIRPSFYYPLTSTIYIDPNSLWLTEEEQNTIDPAPDFRSEFGSELLFTVPWRYVAAGDKDIRALERNLDSVTLTTTSLFYHELAHANDYFPPESLDTIDRNTAIQNLSVSPRSSLLSGTFPLQSRQMFDLAEVSFGGETATINEITLTAEDIAYEFSADVANDFYNYHTEREDFAMVFEEAMMLYSYGVNRDVAVTTLPQTSNDCADYIVAWGQRNRVSGSAIKPRALFAVTAVLPEIADDVENLLDTYSPTQMRVGEDYCSNIFLDATRSRAMVSDTQPRLQLTPETRLPYQ